MKTKNYLFALMFITLISCKKESSTPNNTQSSSSSSTTTQSAQKYYFQYDYKKPGDNTIYSGSVCCTEADMTNKISLYGYFNVVNWHPC